MQVLCCSFRKHFVQAYFSHSCITIRTTDQMSRFQLSLLFHHPIYTQHIFTNGYISFGHIVTQNSPMSHWRRGAGPLLRVCGLIPDWSHIVLALHHRGLYCQLKQFNATLSCLRKCQWNISFAVITKCFYHRVTVALKQDNTPPCGIHFWFSHWLVLHYRVMDNKPKWKH